MAMDIAKCIRNASINTNARAMVARNIADYLEKIDPDIPRTIFMQVATGVIETDTRTHMHSLIS